MRILYENEQEMTVSPYRGYYVLYCQEMKEQTIRKIPQFERLFSENGIVF